MQNDPTAWEKNRATEEVAHRAYLEKQRARIAEVAAAGEEAQAKIKDLSERREQMLLTMHRLEAQKARERAQAAQAQGEAYPVAPNNAAAGRARETVVWKL